MKKFKFKNDKYKNAREGSSRILSISCQKCDKFICFYQKDGSGSLRRMYFDRIIEPQVSISRKDFSCSCGHLMGVKMIYEKERRLAFRLFVDSIIKRVIKSSL